MGWGFLSGLGQGLTESAKLPHQYYQDVEQAKLDKSRLEMEALSRALAEQNMRFSAENHPLEMEATRANTRQSDAATGLSKTQQAAAVQKVLQGHTVSDVARKMLEEQGMGGVINAQGGIDEDPTVLSNIATNKAQAAAAYANAHQSNAAADIVYPAQARYSDANAAESKARAGLYDVQAKAGGFRPGGTAAGGSDPAKLILATAAQYNKAMLDSSKWDIMGAKSPQEKMQIIGNLRQQSINAAIAAYEQVHGKLDPATRAAVQASPTLEAQQNPAIAGALGPDDTELP